MTNDIVQVVAEAQSSLTSVNTTVIWIAVIQLVGTVLAAWTTILSRIILKDVNSDRTKRIQEVQDLNDSLARLSQRNTLLAERGRVAYEAVSGKVSTVSEAISAIKKPTEVPTVDDTVVKIVDDAIVEERDRVAFDNVVTEPPHDIKSVKKLSTDRELQTLKAEDEASERKLNQTHDEFVHKIPGQPNKPDIEPTDPIP